MQWSENFQLVVSKSVSFRTWEGYWFAQTEEIRPERSEVLAPEQATTSWLFSRNEMTPYPIPFTYSILLDKKSTPRTKSRSAFKMLLSN